MARKKRSSIEIRDGYHTIVMSDMEIWDGADLALLREHLAKLVDADGEKSIGVDMTFVKYVPSGFFGMLYDYTERGVTMRVFNPLPHVQDMLWFREFFDHLGDGVFCLSLRQQTSMSNREAAASGIAPWSTDEVFQPTKPILERRDHAVVVQ
jgi:hypothetical protein